MNTPRRRPNDEARTALVNVELIAIEIDTALIAIDRALAGWPEQTPGAAPAEARPPAPCTHPDCTHIRPCPTHDADLIAEGQVKLTGPERGAAQGDRARIDLERLLDHIRLLAHHARAAADITHHWSVGAISSAEVADKLEQIWCRNCQRHGVHNVRDGAHLDCAECRRFRSRWKRDAPKLIIDARGRGKNLSEADEKRILDRDKRERDEADRAAERRAERAKRTIAS